MSFFISVVRHSSFFRLYEFIFRLLFFVLLTNKVNFVRDEECLSLNGSKRLFNLPSQETINLTGGRNQFPNGKGDKGI